MGGATPTTIETAQDFGPGNRAGNDLTAALTPLEARLARIEDSLGRENRGLDARVLKLEGGAAPGAPANPFPWDKLLSIIQIVAMPLVLAFVGWLLTNKLDLAIKQQQADLEGVKEMQSPLKTLYAQSPADEDLDPAALTLGAFGGVAAGPLIQAYELPGPIRKEAARMGLVAAGVRDKVRVCEILDVASLSTDVVYKQQTRTMINDIRQGLKCG